MHRKLKFRQWIFTGKYLCTLAGAMHLVGCSAGQSVPQEKLGLQADSSPGGGEEHPNSVELEKVAVAQPKSVQQQEGPGSAVAEGNPTQGKNFAVLELGTEMIWVQPGTFLMGSPEGEEGRDDDEVQHTVEITKGFWLGKFEVTQAEYQEIMGENPSKSGVGPKLPVEMVSWVKAMEFCAILTDRERDAKRLPAGYEYSLPTEAEWEYSCRAGTTAARYSADVSDIAWFRENTAKSREVGEKNRPNAWGLHDMIGNVWEWCADWYAPYPTEPVKDPEGQGTGDYRVMRGCGWRATGTQQCRAADRIGLAPETGFNGLGFRLCLRPVAEASK